MQQWIIWRDDSVVSQSQNSSSINKSSEMNKSFVHQRPLSKIMPYLALVWKTRRTEGQSLPTDTETASSPPTSSFPNAMRFWETAKYLCKQKARNSQSMPSTKLESLKVYSWMSVCPFLSLILLVSSMINPSMTPSFTCFNDNIIYMAL